MGNHVLDPLSYWGNLASITGLLISIYLAFKVNQIKKRYHFDENVKPILRELRKNSSEIRQYLSGKFSAEEPNIRRQLHKYSAHLKHLSKMVDGYTERVSLYFEYQVMCWKISRPITEAEAISFSVRLDAIIVDFETRLKLNSWEIRHG